MWWMLGTALAGSFFEPVPIRGAMRTEVSGQTYRTGDTWLSGANATMQVRQDRFVFGGSMRLLDDPYASEQWSVHAANLLFGYQAIRTRRTIVMPYLRAGSHLQAGISARITVPMGPHRLIVDASGGPSWRRPDTAFARPVWGIDAEPGAPEAGVALRIGTSWRPTVRVGVLGEYLAGSVSVGKTFQLRTGATWQPNGSTGLGFLSIRVRA